MTTTNTADLRAALIEARDWFESQAKAVSKGCGSSYELHDLRVQRDALDAALATPAQEDTCEWLLTDEDNGVWGSGCGEAWCFIDGGPEDNNMRFCHGCGKPVAIAAQQGTTNGR